MKKLQIAMCVALAALAAPTLASEGSNRETAWKFAEAVRDGGDPTLGGAITVTTDQAARLSLLAGCKFRRMPVSNNVRSIFMWSCPKAREGHDFLTDLLFSEGRIVVLDISTAVRK